VSVGANPASKFLFCSVQVWCWWYSEVKVFCDRIQALAGLGISFALRFREARGAHTVHAEQKKV